MAEKGYILLHRKIWDNPILVTGERFDHMSAWLWLITHANYTEKSVMIRGSLYKIQRGQVFTSVRKLSEVWGWDKETVGRTLNLFEREEMIYKTRTPNGTLITIRNFNKYQDYRASNENNPYTDPDTEPYMEPDTMPTRLSKDKRRITKEKEKMRGGRVIE